MRLTPGWRRCKRHADAKQARELLLRAVLRSREHFDKEERIVFPLAERVMKAKTLVGLGDEWMKRREAVLS